MFLTAGKQDPRASTLDNVVHFLHHPDVFTFVITIGADVDLNEVKPVVQNNDYLLIVRRFTDLVPRVNDIAKRVFSSKSLQLNASEK